MARSVGKAGGAILVVLVAAALLEYFAPYSHEPLEQTVPQFILCETSWGKPCHESLPTRWISDFYETMGEHVAAVVRAGRRPVILHVGANDFTDDTPEYRPIVTALRVHGLLHMVLVEPNADKVEELRKVHASMMLPERSVSIVSAAMKGNCSKQEFMHVFSDQLFLDFAPPEHRGMLRSSLRSWKSFNPKHAMTALESVANSPMYTTGEGSAAQYDLWHSVVVPWVKKIWAVGNASSYLVQEPVKCLTAGSLLVEVNITPQDIVMMTVDAESYDVEIVEGFLRLPRFRPSLLRWEGNALEERQAALIATLRTAGFSLGQTSQGHSNDIVAVL